ncbi:MAG: hypothetical protein NC218_08020 [Acetobacter sp.]|nr:hypothetical protein [Acetobacter sp.]
MIRCNNCYKTFKDDDELLLLWDVRNGYFKGCPNCKTDSYLMDIGTEVQNKKRAERNADK